MTIETLMSHLSTCKDHASSIAIFLDDSICKPGEFRLSIEDVPQQLKFLHKQLTDMHNFVPKESVNADDVWMICMYQSRAIYLVNAVDKLLSMDKLDKQTVIDKLREANSLTDCNYGQSNQTSSTSTELDITKL